MRIVAGLGNPGADYQMTRHNAGIILVEKLAEKLSSDYGWRAEKEAMIFKSEGIILAKAKDKFMNQSGEWIKWLVNYYANQTDTKDLWVVHDDLDIRLGEYKIQFGTGPKDHGGINSIEAILGTKDFWRVRLGVDNRRTEFRESGDEYVLKRFLGEELEIVGGETDAAIKEVLEFEKME